MKILRISRALSTLLTLFVFVSCGTNNFAGGGIGGTGVSVGKITAFGSVFVNGVEFDTKGSSVTLDGTSGAQDDLRIGMIVTVKGTFDASGKTGTADSVEFKDNLEGPIASVDPASKTFVVLGQTVKVDIATILEDTRTIPTTEVLNADILTTLDSATGSIVKVSGFVEADGSIRATYIKLKTFTQGEEIELKGTISNLDVNNAKTFKIGTLVVYYGNAELKDIPGGSLSDGLFVEVKSTAGFNNAGALIASKIEAEDAVPDRKEWDRAEIQGYARNVTSTPDSEKSFEVNGQPVLTTSTTEYRNGAKADIVSNVRVEVRGTVDANGVLIAQEISIEDSGGEASKDVSSDTGGLPGTEGTL